VSLQEDGIEHFESLPIWTRKANIVVIYNDFIRFRTYAGVKQENNQFVQKVKIWFGINGKGVWLFCVDNCGNVLKSKNKENKIKSQSALKIPPAAIFAFAFLNLLILEMDLSV